MKRLSVQISKRIFALFTVLTMLLILALPSLAAAPGESNASTLLSAPNDSLNESSVLQKQISATPETNTLTNGDGPMTVPLSTNQYVVPTSSSESGITPMSNETIPVGNQTALQNAINNAPDDVPTTIELINDISAPYATFSIPENKVITLTGDFVLYGSNLGYTINVQSNAALTLDGITVSTTTKYAEPGIYVSNDATLAMLSGAISGNKRGVAVSKDGTFTMNGGSISDNVFVNPGGFDSSGMGVNNSGGTFIMNEGEITGNAGAFGGGVFSTGIFELNGGVIQENYALYDGGGIRNSGTFTMTDGEIINNRAERNGGGVYYTYHAAGASPCTFTMQGGGIRNNICGTNAEDNLNTKGGGVYNNAQVLTLNGGSIDHNSAYEGGGIYTTGGTVTMTSGKIDENSASAYGGGVYSNNTTLAINGGRISGNKAAIDGGGIWINYTELSRLTVDTQAVFSDNLASQAYERSSIDDQTYLNHIQGTQWTHPLTQGYNNYDISYEGGTAIDLILTITFMNDTQQVDQYTLDYGGKATPTTVSVEKSGYIFQGWADSGETLWDFDTPVKEHLTLYAQWQQKSGGGVITPSTYAVNYHANGGTGSLSDPNSPYNVSSQVTVLSPDRAIGCEGYAFQGWNTSRNGSGTAYDPGDTFTLSQNTTLYAQWKEQGPEQHYAVTYHPNGGTGSLVDPNSPYLAGSAVTVLSPYEAITRSGYGFSGWNTKEDGTGTVYFAGSQLLLERDTDLYAQWKEHSNPSGGGGGIELIDPIPPLGPWALNLDDHYAYLIGYPDGRVAPQGNITREEAATIFFRLLSEGTRNELLRRNAAFPDVMEDRWSNTAVSTLNSAGLLQGLPNGTFSPGQSITRAEFAAIASRFDTSVLAFHVTFSDTEGHWAEDAISRAACLGWITGNPDGSFAPDAYITRAEVSSIVNRMLLRLPEGPESLLPDMIVWPDNADTSAWYYLAIQEATNSHDYAREAGSIYEFWTQITPSFDWTVYQ